MVCFFTPHERGLAWDQGAAWRARRASRQDEDLEEKLVRSPLVTSLLSVGGRVASFLHI